MQDLESLQQRAIQYYQQGFFEQAIGCYKEMLSIQPTQAVCYYNLAQAYWAIDEQVLAIQAYHQAIKIKPDYSNALLNLGIAYTKRNELKQAINIFKQALIFNKNALLYCYLGHAYQLNHEFRKAIKSYRQAVKLEKKPEYYTYLANILEIQQQWQESLKAYKQARILHPKRKLIPPILLNTLPKSASMYIWTVLSQGLNSEQFHISAGGFANDRINPWLLQRLALGGSIAQAHLPSHQDNLTLLDHYLEKWIIHIRDPRQAMLSWVYHLDLLLKKDEQYFINIHHLPSDYSQWNFTRKIDWNIQHYFPILIKWIEGWKNIARKNPKIIFTYYEDLHSNPQKFFKNILKIYHINPELFIDRIEQPKNSRTHFRKGQIDEWRKILTSQQIHNLQVQIPEDLSQAFNWEN